VNPINPGHAVPQGLRRPLQILSGCHLFGGKQTGGHRAGKYPKSPPGGHQKGERATDAADLSSPFHCARRYHRIVKPVYATLRVLLVVLRMPSWQSQTVRGEWRLLKGGWGRSIDGEIQSVRLQRGMQYLVDTHDPMSVIAGKSGFRTPHRMDAVFRKHIGMTPRQYRRRGQYDVQFRVPSGNLGMRGALP